MDSTSPGLLLIAFGLLGGVLGYFVGAQFVYHDRSAPSIGFFVGAITAIILAEMLKLLLGIAVVCAAIFIVIKRYGHTIADHIGHLRGVKKPTPKSFGDHWSAIELEYQQRKVYIETSALDEDEKTRQLEIAERWRNDECAKLQGGSRL